MHVRGSGLHRVDQASVLVHADVVFHAVGAAFREAVIPLVALFGLVHFRIPLPSFVFRGAEGGNQGGVDDRALLHGHAALFEVSFHRLKDLLAQIVLFQQVPEGQDRRLVWNPVADQLDSRKPAHVWHLDQVLLHAWIAKALPLLHQMNPQHGGQGVGRAATFLAIPRVARLDQIDQRLPRHHLIHLSEKRLRLGALLGRGLLVIAETKLLAAHQLSRGLGLLSHCLAG